MADYRNTTSEPKAGETNVTSPTRLLSFVTQLRLQTEFDVSRKRLRQRR